MKANKGQAAKALDAGGGDYRLFLLYGPDEGGSRAMAQRLSRAMGADAERIELDGATLSADPARLADEAASFSLFGGKRYVIVTLKDREEDAIPAIEAMLDGPEGNPVIILARALKASSGLVKRLLAEPRACCLASYVPDADEMAEIARGLGREQGLRLHADCARRLVTLAGSDREVLASEIEKLALYLDASPAQPSEASAADIEAIGAANGDPELSEFYNAVLGGKPDATASQITALGADGMEGIGLIRPLAKRVQTLLGLRLELERGKPMESVTQPVFWKDKKAVADQLRRWPSARLASAADRLLAAERAIKSSGSVGPILADVEIVLISRAGQRGR